MEPVPTSTGPADRYGGSVSSPKLSSRLCRSIDTKTRAPCSGSCSCLRDLGTTLAPSGRGFNVWRLEHSLSMSQRLLHAKVEPGLGGILTSFSRPIWSASRTQAMPQHCSQPLPFHRRHHRPLPRGRSGAVYRPSSPGGARSLARRVPSCPRV